MIDDVTKYRYVTGDLNTIIIDGNIMPRRNNNDKKLLRGEDITFCMEVLRRRMTYPITKSKSFTSQKELWNFEIPSSYKSSFSQKVCEENYTDIIKHGLTDCGYNPIYRVTTVSDKSHYSPYFIADFLSEIPTEESYHYDISSGKTIDEFFVNDAFSFLKHDSRTSNYTMFKNGNPLKQNEVEKIFDDIKTLDKICVDLKSYGVYFSQDELQMSNFTKWYDPQGYEPIWPTSPQYLGYYMYGFKDGSNYNYYYSYYGASPDITVEITTDLLNDNQKLWVMFGVEDVFYNVNDITYKDYYILKMVDDTPVKNGNKYTYKFSVDKQLIDSIA